MENCSTMKHFGKSMRCKFEWYYSRVLCSNGGQLFNACHFSRDKRRGGYEKTFALLMRIIIAGMIKRENNFARKCARRRKCRSLHGKLHDFDISRCQE